MKRNGVPARFIAGLAATLFLGGLAWGSGAESEGSARSRLPDSAGAQAFQDSLTKARDLLKQGTYADAEAMARRLLAAIRPTGRADSLRLADVLDMLVESRSRARKGKEEEAKGFGERAVAIRETIQGPDHLDVATSLTNLGTLLRVTGDYAGAKPLLERALAIREKALAPDHLDVATSLANLGIVLRVTGDYTGAKSLHERALAIREKSLGPDHPDVAASLNYLAPVLVELGDFAGARSRYERAIAIYEKAQGLDSPLVAAILSNLAALLRKTGNYAEARPLYERSLAIKEKAFGADHPSVAPTLINFANLLRTIGDYAGARPLYERAIAIDEKVLGPDHPDLALDYDNLATLLRDTGDYSEARALYQRALAIEVKALDPDHPTTANTMDNLASLLLDMGAYSEAKPLFERALAIREKTDHPELAITLYGLANLLHITGDLVGAKPLYERSLAIREKLLGPDHIELAWSQRDLGRLLAETGDYVGARPLFERALAIREKALGPEHPWVAASLNDLAALLRDTGDLNAALTAALRAERIGRQHLRLTARALPERQALVYASVRASGLDVALSLTEGSKAPESRREIFDALIRSRALVLDEVAVRHSGVGMACHIADLAQSYASAQQRLANLTVRGPGSDAPERYRALVESTRKESETAEAALAARCELLRRDLAKREIGLREVASALPSGDALVAYVRHEQANAVPKGSQMTKSEVYRALVLRGGETRIETVNLGNAPELATLVEQWREQVSRPGRSAESETACRSAGEALRRRIWDPVTPLIRGAKHVFVVPDGPLHLVSFAALPVGDSEYLVESGPIVHYLSAERDLVTPEETPPRGRGLLALGGPAFDDSAALVLGSSETAEDRSPLASSGELQYRGERSGCAEFRAMRFSALPASIREVEEIVSLWESGRDGRSRSEVVQLTGVSASEAAFKAQVTGRSVLHVATHGFFLEGRCPSALDSQRGVETNEVPKPSQSSVTAGDNPLLLSGLALAGANRRGEADPAQDDGILTAEEIATLDLSGVDWAVLSACDTGVGELKASEGVLGLRRAFEVAGAGTLIMSLWSVEDESARKWMRALYEARFARKQETAAAVRDASRQLLGERRQRGESTRPFYWAAFVAAGDWR